MRKFVPRSDFGIFRNERIQSTPLDLRSILVHLVSFRNYKKLGAKRGELVQLMQKFVPRSDVGIFCNERTKSTPLETKLMFWCISFHLCAFETIWILHKTRCKIGQPGAIKAEVRATKSHQKFSKWMLWSTYWTLSSCFHAFLSILGAFGTISVWVHLGPLRFCTNLMQNTPNWCN